MPTVHERMKEEARRIYAKVEVIYTDPFIDDSNVATATETGRFTSANQVKDLQDTPDYKYFSLHNNKLDGTFHPLPASLNNGESVGWWGAHLSGGGGSLEVVNLLGTDGNCEDVSKWGGTVSIALDAANKLYGANAFKLTLGASAGEIYQSYPVTLGKYYIALADVKNGNATQIYIKTNTTQYGAGNSTGNFQVSYSKFTPGATGLAKVSIELSGVSGQFAYVDGVRMFEISAAEYAAIDTMTAEQVAARYPYVDGQITPPTITLTFDARAIFFLKVAGDNLLNEFPVDFTIKLYNPSNVLQYTETVTGNTLVYWTKDIADIGNIAKIELTITKINKPSSAPKILEFYTAVSEVYDQDRVIDINLLEEQSFDEFTLPIGNVSSNEIDIKFDNTDKHFDPRNSTSSLYGQLKKNRKVKPYLGVDIEGNGIPTWFPLGLFYTTEWKAPTHGVFASLVARDRLELLKQREFTTSTVYSNYNLYQMAELVLQDFGLTAKDYSLDTALQSVIVPYMWFDRVSHRAALEKVAEAGLARLYCDRLGIVRMEVNRTASASLFAFTDDETLFSTDYPLAAGQIANYVECVANPRIVAAAAGNIYQSTDTVTVPANGTITQTYKFNFLPCVQVTIPTITAGANITVQSWTAYAWGTVVTFANSAAAAQTVTSITVSGKKLDINGGSVAVAQDASSIHDNGKLTYKIENEFIQTLSRAQGISDAILAAYKSPRHDIDMSTRGHVSLQLGDRVTAPGFDVGTTQDYYIVRQNIRWDGALDAQIKGLKT